MDSLTTKNIYMMGFMGSGKTRVGSLLASRLDRPYLDTDELIVQEASMSIPEIFSKLGEPRFRQYEIEIIARVAALKEHVIALGGGAVLNPENWERITRSGVTVCLSYPPEIIDRRLARKTDRPLVNENTPEARLARITELMSRREAVYRKADLVLHLNVETDAEKVADAIAGYLGVFQ